MREKRRGVREKPRVPDGVNMGKKSIKEHTSERVSMG